MQSIPRVGPVTVNTFIVDLPEIGTHLLREISALVGARNWAQATSYACLPNEPAQRCRDRRPLIDLRNATDPESTRSALM